MSDKRQIHTPAKVAKNSLVQMAGGVLNKILSVLLVIYAARQLGTTGFGVYAYVLSLLGIFYIFTDFGLGTLTTRDLARNPEAEGRYLGALLGLRLLLSAFAAAAMVVTVASLGQPGKVVQLAAIAAVSLFFTSGVDSCTAVFNAHQRMEITSLVSVVATLLRVGISLGALASGAGLGALLVIYTAALAFQFALLFWILVATYHVQPLVSFTPAFWKKLMLEALPLALANLFAIVYFRIDTIMLASMTGTEAVGWYNAAYRLLEFTMMMPAYYGGAVFPVVSASYQNNPQRFMLIYRRSLKYMLVASVPLAIGAATLSPGFIKVLYGNDYLPSVPVLSVLMWSLVLISANSINAPYLIAMGRQKTVGILTAAGMVINILLNLVAIPRYGILGAAWVTLISEVVTIVMFLSVLRQPLSLNWKLMRHILRPLLAGGVMYLGLRWVPGWDLGFQILLGAAIYLSLLLVFRVFDEVDFELFGKVLRPSAPADGKLEA